MKVKEKMVLFLIFLLFSLSVFMFYYQNFYRPNLIEMNKAHILIAKEDIDKNTELNEKNMEWIKIDEEILNADYVVKIEEAIGKKTSEKMFKGEFINKQRIQGDEEEKFAFDTYTIDIVPDFSTDLKNGDLVKVYVQTVEITEDKKQDINNLLVFDKKEIIEVQRSEQTGEIIRIKIRATDKDSISYFNAKIMGSVIALKYEGIMDNPDFNIPIININQSAKEVIKTEE